MKSPTPPHLFLRFFRWYCHPKMQDYIEGDLMEMYEKRLNEFGKRKADVKFIIDVLLLFRPGIIKPAEGYKNLNTYGMYKSYFKTAWRSLRKGKTYSSINLLGMGIGMTVALLIGLWILDELSYDSYFGNHSNLAQVMVNQTHEGITYTGTTVSPTIAVPLRTTYAGDFKALSLVSWNNGHVLTKDDKKLSGSGRWVESEFPEMFTLEMLSGSHSSLKDPSTILLSRSLAKSLFGEENAVNRSVRIDNQLDMNIGGVYEDFPHNTTFYGTEFLLPWTNKANWLNTVTEWDNHSCQLFVQLTDHAETNDVNRKIKNLPTSYIQGWKEEIMIHPLDRLHLFGEFKNGKETGGRIEFVWLFGIIGVFVLFLACINFMNLSTARSEKRSKEVGIRKTVGSARSQLIQQFLSESIVVSLAAVLLSLVVTQLSLPFFNTLSDKMITMPWGSTLFWIVLIGFALASGIVSGSYPAFYLSSFKPVKVLKSSFKPGRLAVTPRKILVVVQFTVSITLVVGTLIVYRQIQFAKDRPAGYSREGMITVPINTDDIQKHYQAIRNDLLQTGVIENIAESSQSPAHFGNNTSIEWPGYNPESVIFFRNVTVTPDFGETIGWTIKSGRDFSKDMVTDSSSVVLNEKAIEIMGLENPIGERVKYDGQDYTIIGIADNMVTQSPYDPIEPTVFFGKGWFGVIIIRLKPTAPLRESLAKIEPVFKKYNPSSPFQFSFVDEEYGRKFSNEVRVGNLASVFAFLAIFISCMGLFGLSSFVAEQRTKEIGIRKVMGASVTSLWKMLSMDFMVLIIISLIIAIPLSLYFMLNWLEHYEYRTSLSWYIFASAGVGAIVITLATVSIQAIKAAIANPVNSLKAD